MGIKNSEDLDEWTTSWQRIEERVSQAVKGAGHAENLVIYSAYETQDDVPVDNLDEIAVHGRCVLTQKRSEFFGGPASRDYCSAVLTDPTWLQVSIVANEAIAVTNDRHHVFLEGVDIRGASEDGVVYLELVMGS